jgi:hypothetical protein
MGDEYARHTKMLPYTPKQAYEADISLYNRLLSDEQKTGPGRMPERDTTNGQITTTQTTGWGKGDIAVSGVSHQPEIQAYHHSSSRLVLEEQSNHIQHQRLQSIERTRANQEQRDILIAREQEAARQKRLERLNKLLGSTGAASGSGRSRSRSRGSSPDLSINTPSNTPIKKKVVGKGKGTKLVSLPEHSPIKGHGFGGFDQLG